MSVEATRIMEAGHSAVLGAATVAELAEVEIHLLGKKSELSQARRSLGAMDPERRREAGAALNAAKEALLRAIESRKAELAAAEQRERLQAEALDLTRFVEPVSRGHVHPVTATRERLEDIFVGLGFEVAEGPDLETDWFNFEALNIPAHHPARGMHDTFHLDVGEPGDYVLRTHTSPVQIRHMRAVAAERGGPPIYAVMPGRVYRNERTDATHLAALNQLEGLVVDRHITLGHLAGTIDAFIKAYFGTEFETRFRPSYFPFTEPSAEVDMRVPGGAWLEIGGCGMVHPTVLRNGGIDPEEWAGFAFGFGIDRLAKMRHDVSDIREFERNDIRFLSQF
ncbi:MAG: phenylalanine--tRNA ligase subunit alpha [Microthrixaceae bacterium]